MNNEKNGKVGAADAYYIKMTETPVPRLIVTLGIPTMISMLITNIYNMVDTYFVGTLGESQQAATGILFTLQAIIQAVAFMLGQGSGSMVAKALADRNTKEASEYVSTAFFTAIGFGTLFSAAGFLSLEPLLRALGSTETILPYARDYGMWVLISAPVVIASFVLNNNLRYEGKAIYAMVGLVTGGIINILGDYIFVFVLGMGVFGAGLATAISQAISFCILLFFHIKMAQGDIGISHVARRAVIYLTICRIGFPAMIRQGLSSLSNGILNNLTKSYGDAAIAAISVVNRFSAFLMCVGLGIGQGLQPVASYNYQAKKYKRVKQALVFTMAAGFVLIGIISIPSMMFPRQIVSLFQKSEDVLAIGEFALRMASFGVLFLSLSVPVNMLFQSIRKPEISSVLSLLRSGLLMIPTLFITTSLWGLTGIQISQPIADILTGLISIPFILWFLKSTPSSDEVSER
ncbi:MAG: MATE family efflux transporter [Clostridia bacterium]|nr:MATE family efflux transporter [Clostridia bacterium]